MRRANLKSGIGLVLSALFLSGIADAHLQPMHDLLLARCCDTSDDDSSFDNIEIIDPGLKGKLTVLRVGSEPSPNNLLTVFVGLRNKTSQTLRLEVETIYKDSEDKPLNAGSWVKLTLKPHEDKEYRSASVSEQFDPNAVDAHFMIRVRRAVTPSAAAQ